jgi:RNA polymerase sigma-70 factor (ECF subfamily)
MTRKRMTQVNRSVFRTVVYWVFVEEWSALQQPPEISVILKRLAAGDQAAKDELFPLVYDELRKLAGWLLRRERPGHTLQPTALVHEAYLRLAGQANLDWPSRVYFFASASTIMRRILVDHARAWRAEKRGGAHERVPLDDQIQLSNERLEFITDLDEALSRLAERDERLAKVVEMRFFAGMTEEEIGLLLGRSSRSIKRDWVVAKAWLQAELKSG